MCGSLRQPSFKEFEDKILGTIFLLVGMPLMVVVAVLIKLTSPGPVLYVQKRQGVGGSRFRVYKFRTMRCRGRNARSNSGVNATARVTWLGRFLRATSIDELPQLFNVIKGEMSLVGPRPHPLTLNRRYVDVVEQLRWRHCVKPGMTGLAQINGSRGPIRTTNDMRRRIQYDLEYIECWSPMLDLKIIGLTLLRGFLQRES
jgi:putative colanic acid biosysnthesis UDP-glucose lipid carrier transferase